MGPYNCRWKRYITAASSIAILGLSVSCNNADSQDGISMEISAEIIVQDVKDRVYTEWNLERLKLHTEPVLGNIDQMVIMDGEIFLSDMGDMRVKRFGTDGKLKATYGQNRGKGPGEFRNIYSFWSHEQEHVWIIDSMNRTVSQFGYSDGSYLSSFTPDYMAARVAAINRDTLVILAYMNPELFVMVNSEGEVLGNFNGTVEAVSDVPTIIYDGKLHPYGTRRFVWAPRFASYLYIFDERARLSRRINLIDGHGYPFDRLSSNRMRFTASELSQPHRTIAMSMTDVDIFVNTVVRDEHSSYNVLDRYDRATGKYIDSARMPDKGNQYQVYDGVIFSAGADTTIWAFSFSTPM